MTCCIRCLVSVLILFVSVCQNGLHAVKKDRLRENVETTSEASAADTAVNNKRLTPFSLLTKWKRLWSGTYQRTQRRPQSGRYVTSMSGGKFETVNFQATKYPMICLPVPAQIQPSCVNGSLTLLLRPEMGKVKNILQLLYINYWQVYCSTCVTTTQMLPTSWTRRTHSSRDYTEH